MTPNDEIPEDERPLDEVQDGEAEGEGEEGRGGKGKAEGEGAGAGAGSKQTVSPAAFEFLTRVGATMAQISTILSQWAHLKGDALTRALNDFARDIARASSQPQVQFDGKDVSIITTFFRYITGRDRPIARPSTSDVRPRTGPR